MNITAVEEAEYRRVKTSVWWDIENCPVPKGSDAQGIALKLSSALMKTNYCGPLSISSYGNTNLIPNSIQQALSSTGIALNHVPSGKKNASDKKILVDMLLWVVENPAPANIMLISGDGDFSDALHLLRMRKYNILLAHPQQASPLLVASATTTWLWGSLFPLTQCESSSRLVDNESYPSVFDISSQGVSEQVLSNQSMGSESMPIQGLEIKSGEPENALAGPSEHLEENMNEKKKRKKKKKKSRVIEDKTEAYVCSICSVIFYSSTVFEFHINGRKHKNAAMIKKHTEALLDDKQIEEEIIQDNGHLKEMIEKKKDKVTKEAYVCSICSVICNCAISFGFHLMGRRHAARVKKHVECEPKQNLKLLGEPGNMVASECHEKDVEMANKMVEAGVETSSCSVRPSQTPFDSHLKNATIMKKQTEALFDVKNIEESVQDSDQDSMKCFEEQNKELVETCTTSETSGRELRKVFKESRECFEAILKKLEPSINEIVIEKLEKQGLEMKSCEPYNSLAGPSEHLEENMNEKKKKKKRKKSKVTEAYVCSICNVVCDYPTILESHLKGRKHAAKIKKHTKALLDGKQIEEEIIQDNGHLKEMIEELQFQPGEAHEHIGCLEEQNKELGENENKPLPNEECIFTKLNPEFLAPREAREGVDEIITKLELSQDAKQNLEMNSGDPESNSGGATEHTEEYMNKKKKDKVMTKEAYVCSICSVICNCAISFESHLMGRRHAARVKKHEEVRFDDKKTLEKSLEEKDHPIDVLQEVRFQPEEVQETSSIREVCQITTEGLENESGAQVRDPECFFTKPNRELLELKEARERLDSIIKRIELSVEDASV